jgi:hypothetical protein
MPAMPVKHSNEKSIPDCCGDFGDTYCENEVLTV